LFGKNTAKRNKRDKKIALIINCDKVKVNAIYGIMEELARFKETSIHKAYGN
jgi:hypothetical protein